MLENLLKQHPDNEIVILSGEGEIGTFEKYNGKRTVKEIRSRLTSERCHGDRWAKAYMYMHESETGRVYISLDETNQDCRCIRKEDING